MDELIELVRAYQNAKSLPERMRAGEAIAQTVGPALRHYVASHSPPEWAADVFQEAMEGLFRNILRFHGTTDGQFWRWCYHIARNRCNERLRRISTDPLTRMDPDQLWHSVEFAAREEPMSAGDRLDLEYALDLLRQAKPPCYDYLWKFYVLGWELGEVAQSSGLSYNGARMQIRRCLELAQSLITRTA